MHLFSTIWCVLVTLDCTLKHCRSLSLSLTEYYFFKLFYISIQHSLGSSFFVSLRIDVKLIPNILPMIKQPNADRLHASFADELHAVDVGRGDGPELYPAWQGRHACLTDQLHHPDHPPAVLRRQLYLWGEEETQTLDTWVTKHDGFINWGVEGWEGFGGGVVGMEGYFHTYIIKTDPIFFHFNRYYPYLSL